MKSDNINNNTTNNKVNTILSIKKAKDGRNQYTVNIDGKEVIFDEDDIVDERILKTELQNRVKRHFKFFFLSMIPLKEKGEVLTKTVRDFVKNIIQEQFLDCNPFSFYQQLLKQAMSFAFYRDKEFKIAHDLMKKIEEDFYIFNVRSNDEKAEIIKKIKSKDIYTVIKTGFMVNLENAFQLYCCDNRKITSDEKKKILDFLERINEKITLNIYDSANSNDVHIMKIYRDADKKTNEKAEQASIKKDSSTETYEKELLMNFLDKVDIEYLKPIIHCAFRNYIASSMMEFYTSKNVKVGNKFKGDKEKTIINLTQDSTKINQSDVERYDIIRIESCDATKKFDNPKGYRKIGIVVNTDKDKIECLLLNSKDGAGHYPNMQVNGEPIKINNKDFFLSDLPYNMQNEFGNDKLTSYISRDTYTLSNNDKNNMYCCGCLNKNNKKHVDLIESIKKAVEEGCKKYKTTTYKQLGDYIKDFVSEVVEEETNRYNNLMPLPFNKNGKITYKEYVKYLNSVNNEIDDLVDYINGKGELKTSKKNKKTKNKKDTQEDKKEDIKQEDVKEENNVINLNSIGGINLINKTDEEVNNNAMGNNIKGSDKEDVKNTEIKRKRKHKKKKKTKDSNIQADKKEDVKENNNSVAKINTGNANNTNSINPK